MNKKYLAFNGTINLGESIPFMAENTRGAIKAVKAKLDCDPADALDCVVIIDQHHKVIAILPHCNVIE